VPSIAVDEPLAYDSLPSVESEPEPEEAGPPPPAARLAQLRGRAATLLAELLAADKRTPQLAEPPTPSEFEGPDGELLHLQDVVLYLALETLRRKD
jgi:hypothetical protein